MFKGLVSWFSDRLLSKLAVVSGFIFFFNLFHLAQ